MTQSSTFVAALFATSALASPAFAQEYTPPAIPPIRQTIDANGVDVTRGAWVGRTHSVSIGGPGTAGLSWSRTMTSTQSYRDSTAIVISVSGSIYTVGVGGGSESFTLSGTDYVSNQKTGSTLTLSGTTFTYISADGTIYKLDPWGAGKKQYDGDYRVSTITYPTGELLTFNWDLVDNICVPNIHAPDGCFLTSGHRLGSVTSTNGYRLVFTYQVQTPEPDSPAGPGWAAIATVAAQNMSVDPASQSWPTLTITGMAIYGSVAVADSLSRTTAYTYVGGYAAVLSAIKRPGAATNNETFGYTSGLVTQVNNDGVTTNYNYSDLSNVRTTTVSDAIPGDRVVKTDLTTMLVTSDKDEAGKTTAYTYYPGSGLTNTVTAPEGNYGTFTYDGRGNLTQSTATPKAGSGLSAITTSATYPASDATKTWLCVSGTPVVKCNKPVTTTDARGYVTDYAWDSTTGLPTGVTRPAPATGGIRPQTRYSYSSVYAQYLSGGSLFNFATPVTRLTGVSACQTLATCTGAADEVKSSITYGTANALPVTASSGSGNGSLTATSAFTYDPVGNRLTVDGPLSGTADTTRTRYDADREVIGVVDPDPDGAGTLKYRARRITYNADAQVTKVEAGTVTSQTDAAWAAFAPLEAVDTAYDANARAITQKLSSGATSYALTQASYDAIGRFDCSAQRMNTAIYGSLPADACTLGTLGSFGADRITKMTYDADSRPTVSTTAFGTADAAAEATVTYSDNGQVTTLKDGENNLTTYERDGFDRVSKLRYPLPTKGANASSTTDYEQPTYDANGNVTALRNRAVQTTSFTYDHLNRVTLKNLPGTEPDVTYAYDNLGRPTSASQTGNALAFGWDALSRKTSETGPLGTTSFGYDLAGRRTSIIYPTTTALTINYAYLTTGDLDTIKQSTTVLADYSYDDLGSRTGVTFGNGAAQAFGYDPVARLTSLTNSLTDTNDLTATFTYNPASQIASNVRTGDAYAFTGRTNANTATVSNGLNQQTSIGGATATWDTNGNLTAEPQSGKGYAYSSENLLTSSTGGTAAALTYDPALRLYQVAGAATTRFLYDGSDAIAEYNASNALQRRFVFDPTSGQPVLWYEGTGTAATNRRYLSQDERGSVISVSGSTGASLGLNTYDEYGLPGAANLGRFQYTGQKWIGEANLYDYKARDYLPGLGVFAQTDPIGPDGGINLYAYVGGDPVNATDPLGLAWPNNPCPTIDGEIVCTGSGPGGPSANDIDFNDRFFWDIFTERLSDNFGFGGDSGGGGGGGGGLAASVSRTWNNVQSRICSALSGLGNNGRIRLGADVQSYGGIGGAAGTGVFVDAKGRLGFDLYYGWGAGFGFAGGAGLTIGNDRPTPGKVHINHLQGTIGLGLFGASGTYSKQEGGTLSGGAGVGPKIGIAAGSVTGTQETTYRGSLC